MKNSEFITIELLRVIAVLLISFFLCSYLMPSCMGKQRVTRGFAKIEKVATTETVVFADIHGGERFTLLPVDNFEPSNYHGFTVEIEGSLVNIRGMEFYKVDTIWAQTGDMVYPRLVHHRNTN